MPSSLRGKATLAVLFLASFLLSSCASLTVRESRKAAIPAGSSFGVLCEGAGDLSLFLSASLMDVGYGVKAVRLEELFPPAILGELRSRDYSVIEGIIDGLSKGGALSGDRKVLDQVLALNDVKERSIKLEDYLRIIDLYSVKAGIQYLMYVRVYGPSSIAVKVLDLKNKEVAYVWFIEGDKTGVAAEIFKTKPLKGNRSTGMGTPSTAWLRLADHVASRLVAGDSK